VWTCIQLYNNFAQPFSCKLKYINSTTITATLFSFTQVRRGWGQSGDAYNYQIVFFVDFSKKMEMESRPFQSVSLNMFSWDTSAVIGMLTVLTEGCLTS